MENYTIVIFILAIMIGLSAIADRIKLPYPVLLIIAGIGVGLGLLVFNSFVHKDTWSL